MNNLNLKRTIQIDPEFDWEYWQLYDMPGSNFVAAVLDKALKDSVNFPGSTYESAFEAVNKMRNKFAKYGAADTDVREVLQSLLEEIYE